MFNFRNSVLLPAVIGTIIIAVFFIFIIIWGILLFEKYSNVYRETLTRDYAENLISICKNINSSSEQFQNLKEYIDRAKKYKYIKDLWITDIKGKLIYHSDAVIFENYKQKQLTYEYQPIYVHTWEYVDGIPEVYEIVQDNFYYTSLIIDQKFIAGIIFHKYPVNFMNIINLKVKNKIIKKTLLFLSSTLPLILIIICGLVLTGIFFFIFNQSKKSMRGLVKDINSVKDDYNLKLNTMTGNVLIDELSSSINNCVSNIIVKTSKEKEEAIVNEKRVLFGFIKKQLFPQILPKIQGYQISILHNNKDSGGPLFYKVQELDAKNKMIFIGDLYSGTPEQQIVSLTLAGMGISKSIDKIINSNDILLTTNTEFNSVAPKDRVPISACCCVLNIATNILNFSSASGMPFIIYKNNISELSNLNLGGLPLGDKYGVDFNSILKFENIKVESGDIIVFMNNAVAQLVNKNNEQYGIGRINEIVKNHYTETTDSLVRYFEKSILEFTAGAVQAQKEQFILVLKKV